MKKVLFVIAHPNLKRSQANQIILKRVDDLPALTVVNLYEKYPYFFINVRAEQKLLLEHDILVLQHPMYWYSMPPLLKQYLDDVLEIGFAYGPHGTHLKGKEFILSITTGGPEDSYSTKGYNNFPIEAFWPPYEQTANLCGMKWHKPLVLHSAQKASRDVIEAHAEKVRGYLSHLSNPVNLDSTR